MSDPIKYWRSLPEYKEYYDSCKNMKPEVLQQGLDMLLDATIKLDKEIYELKARVDALLARRIALCDLKRESKEKK